MATTTTRYQAGVFNVPGSTGEYRVEGLTISPDAVYFIGSNSLTVGSVVSTPSNGLALFTGMMSRLVGSSSVEGMAISFIPGIGRYIAQSPVVCSASETTPAFRADAVSLNPDGFTIDFTTVSDGKVAWLAIDAEGQAAITPYQFYDTATLGLSSYELGFFGRNALYLGARDSDGEGADVAGNYHHIQWGGNAYQDAVVDNDTTAASVIHPQIKGGSSRRETEMETYLLAGDSGSDFLEFLSLGGGYVGPFLNGGYIYGGPTSATEWGFKTRTENGGRAMLWNDVGYGDEFVPATGVGSGVFTAVPPINRVKALIAFTTLDNPVGTYPSTTTSEGMSIGIICQNDDAGTMFHYSVAVDGTSSPRILYQSTSGMVVDVDGSAAGEIQADFTNDNEIGWETTVNGTGSALPRVAFLAWLGGDLSTRHEVPFLGAGYA